jgi:hypothetical protein
MTLPIFAAHFCRAAIVAVPLILSSFSTFSCGSDDPVCGNNKTETGEECDDGNADDTDACRACFVYIPPRTTVTWDFNVYPDRGFSGDSCNETGVASVQVDIVGSVTQSLSDACPKRQVVFLDLPPGPYTISVTPKDGAGNSKVSAPVTAPVTVLPKNVQVDVNIPFEKWTTAYTGLFLYRLSWTGKTCNAATPPLTTQTLTLKVRNQVVSKLTDKGQKVDGTDPKPCRELTEEAPQSIADVPFGPATFEVLGKDSLGVTQYKKTFDTFVGVGQVNPTLMFDVPGPDAAVDAAVDAAPDASL